MTDEPVTTGEAAAEADDEDITFQTADGILFPESRFARTSWDPDIDQPHPYHAVWRYLQGNYRTNAETLPQALILDPDNTKKHQLSAVVKALSDFYKWQREWEHPKLQDQRVTDMVKERAKQGLPKLTREEMVKWTRQDRVSRNQIPASSGDGNADDLMEANGQAGFTDYFHQGDTPAAREMRLRHDVIKHYEKRRVAVFLSSLTCFAMWRTGEPPDFIGNNPGRTPTRPETTA